MEARYPPRDGKSSVIAMTFDRSLPIDITPRKTDKRKLIEIDDKNTILLVFLQK